MTKYRIFAKFYLQYNKLKIEVELIILTQFRDPFSLVTLLNGSVSELKVLSDK